MLTKPEAERSRIAEAISAFPGEEWRPVVGYETTYAVSNLGRVWSYPRPRTAGGPREVRYDHHGYPYVDLYQYGRGRRRRIHILVAEAFIGPRPDGLHVRHIDGDSGNPMAENLAYGTRSENMLDSVAHGTNSSANRTHCPHGHPYDDANTYRWGGRRICLTCKRAADRRRSC